MALLFSCSQRLLNCLVFQPFVLGCTWWSLFQKRVVVNNFDIYICFSKEGYGCKWEWETIQFYTKKQTKAFRVRAMVLNATFNNISIISWRSVLLMEETGVPEEIHRPTTSHWQTLSYKAGFELTTHIKGTACVVMFYISVTVGSSIMSIIHTLKWVWSTP